MTPIIYQTLRGIYLGKNDSYLKKKWCDPHIKNIYFLGSNPDDMSEFDAEIHLSLGEEQEKYVITSPTAIYILAGLMHCPLTWERVDKPVMFSEICMTPRYEPKEDALAPILYNPYIKTD